MSQLTLEIPETLHQQLDQLARREGVSLNQYIIFALTRQVVEGYIVRRLTDEEVFQQEKNFQALLQTFGEATPAEVQAILDEREPVEPEEGLTPELVAALRERMAENS